MPLVAHVALVTGLLCLLPLSQASAACGEPPKMAGGQLVEVDSIRRSFVVREPSGWDGKTPAPVVFAFHPFGMNAQYMLSRAPIARSFPDAIAVYPDAAGSARGWQTSPAAEGNSDLRFFDAMLKWLETNGCIDRRRIVVLGYSNGGQFAHRLACDRPDAIAGIAVAAGRLPCTPPTRMPVILSHGLADSTAPYGQAIEASKLWAQRNACTAPPTPGEAGCSTATGCTDAGLVLCTHTGGHEYDVRFTARAMEFFKTGR